MPNGDTKEPRRLTFDEVKELWVAARLNCGVPLGAEIPLPLIELVAEACRLTEEKVWEINGLKAVDDKSPRIILQ